MLDLVATSVGVALFLGAVALALRVDWLESRPRSALPLKAANEPMGGPVEDPSPDEGGSPGLVRRVGP